MTDKASPYYQYAIEFKDELIEWRRYLHQHPELGCNLPKTTDFVLEKLKSFGYEPRLIAPSAVTVDIGNGNGKTILIRADMDALPMKEDSGLPFSSTCENCHSCGHDMHCTMLLGAAKILKKFEKEINGRVRFMFQPGEEIGAGALSMIENGILEGVDTALAFHVTNGCTPGTYTYSIGCALSSIDIFTVEVEGKQTHGSTPEEGCSALNIAVHVYLGLQELIAREVSPLQTISMTVGAFSCGKYQLTANTVPGHAAMKGTIRSYSDETRNHVVERAKVMVENIGKAYGGTARFIVNASGPSTVNDEKVTLEFAEYLKTVAPNVVVKKSPPLMASEDFAHVSHAVPSGFFMLGADFEDYDVLPNHNPKIRFGEDVLPYGSAGYAKVAIDWLNAHK